jgi:hypothetical protein
MGPQSSATLLGRVILREDPLFDMCETSISDLPAIKSFNEIRYYNFYPNAFLVKYPVLSE